jgi:molecular chaperone DnaK (HSP70)
MTSSPHLLSSSSTIPQADVDVPNISGDHDLHMKLTRASYAELIAPVLERLTQHVEKLLQSAGKGRDRERQTDRDRGEEGAVDKNADR